MPLFSRGSVRFANQVKYLPILVKAVTLTVLRPGAYSFGHTTRKRNDRHKRQKP